MKSSLHSLIHFLPFLLNYLLRLPSPELDPILDNNWLKLTLLQLNSLNFWQKLTLINWTLSTSDNNWLKLTLLQLKSLKFWQKLTLLNWTISTSDKNWLLLIELSQLLTTTDSSELNSLNFWQQLTLLNWTLSTSDNNWLFWTELLRVPYMNHLFTPYLNCLHCKIGKAILATGRGSP
jgi:hypothetical protein